VQDVDRKILEFENVFFGIGSGVAWAAGAIEDLMSM
jgi:ATP-dependent protease HslVU (ClpYQ) peptidase subunit